VSGFSGTIVREIMVKPQQGPTRSPSQLCARKPFKGKGSLRNNGGHKYIMLWSIGTCA